MDELLRRFDFARPRESCTDLGVGLAVRAQGFALPGRRVHGEWDPLLRRIVLYGAAGRDDAALVRTLVHELAHAAGLAEPDATAAAAATARRLPAAERRACGAALRALSAAPGPGAGR